MDSRPAPSGETPAGEAPATSAGRYRFGPFEFDAASAELRRAGQRQRLRQQPAKVLALLLGRPGEVVTREDLRAHLWQRDTFVDFDQGLNYCIKEIRAAIGDNAESPLYIETLPRRGYRWIGPLETAGERPERRLEESVPPQASARPAAVARRWKPTLAWLLAACAAALAAGLGLALWQREAPVAPRWQRLTFRRGLVGAARFAPGGSVVYSAAFDGQAVRLYSSTPGVPEARELRQGPGSLVSVSAPGEVFFLADSQFRGGALLRRAPLAAGAAKDIVDGVRLADATRDGRELAVVRMHPGRPGLFLEFPLGRPGDVFNSPSHLRLSPDGQRLALIEHPMATDDRGYVVVVDREGRATILGPHWGSIEGLAWAPDNRSVWVTAARAGADNALYALGLDGSQREVLATGGRLVLHDIDERGRVLLERSGTRAEIYFGRPGRRELELSWLDASVPLALSDDGRQLLFVESGEGGGPEYATYLRPTDGGPPTRLASGRGVSLSRDGRWAYVVPLRQPDHVDVVPVGPGDARRLQAPGIVAYQWAAALGSGAEVVVGRREGEQMRVWLLDPAAGTPRALTPQRFVVGRDTFSPDGRRFTAICPVRRFCLYDVAGGDPQPLPDMEGRTPLGFDASGRGLYLRVRSPTALVVEHLDLESGRRRPVLDLVPADPVGVAAIASAILTPDGQAWVYGVQRRLSEVFVVDGLMGPPAGR